MGHWHHSNDCSSRVPAQHSHCHSAGGRALTPLITGFAPTRRAYHINRRILLFLPTCTTFIFMHTSNCITLPLGQTLTTQQVSDLKTLLRACSSSTSGILTCYTKGTSQGKVTAQLVNVKAVSYLSPPPHWSAKSSGFSRGHKDAVGTKAQKQPPNLQGKKTELC